MNHFNWDRIEDMFNALHKANCVYIILRNYEEIDEDNFYTSGHADIDFLTTDAKEFASIVKAYPRTDGYDDNIHYKVLINNTEVVIDLRSIGDGYYDTKWEENILNKRIKKDDRFYIADDVNYYYSLTYHAILQKKELADDYLCRLTAMAKALNIDADSEAKHLKALEKFMKTNGYYYTYPFDAWVKIRTEMVDSSMVKKNMNVKVRDFKQSILSFGSKIKHKIVK
ncbi:MAG: hypothetical protein PUE69_00435 [Ruminococcus sp.]|nr:hypothetical protein [Ruminococcus sp.]